jgi:protein phosphatase
MGGAPARVTSVKLSRMRVERRIAIASASHVGHLRSRNEDAVAHDTGIGLLLLADGMGGHAAGDVAAQLAVSTVLEAARAAFDAAGQRWAPPHAVELLSASIRRAHERIAEAGASRADCAGMGTTVAACLLHGATATIAHVGDSRVYLHRGGTLRPLTRDHSLQEELIAQGALGREEARGVPRNILTRALGSGHAPAADVIEQPLLADDLLLLCSDGLTDMLTDSTIESALNTTGGDAQRAVDQLLRLALDEGGRDNISLVIARIAAVPVD